MRALVFPGQGSQSVGMGKGFAEAFASAREVFDEVDEVLNQRLSRLMWQGPDSDLELTENAQPAIMACSISIMRVLEREARLDLSRHARLAAGHSLGEYSALCAVGAFSLADTARLVRIRGIAMQAAAPVGTGGMTALIGIGIDEAAEAVAAATDAGVVVIANDNAPGQVVISGETAALEKAAEIAKQKGAKRVISLPVSTPNHSPLLKRASERMREALQSTVIRPPALPVVSNVTAEPVTEPETIRKLLVEQIISRVRWRESVAGFRASGVAATVEFGGNKVLTGMIRRIDKELQTISIDSPKELEAFASTL